ncbi:MAG: hypothetical protein ACRDI3_01200 [Actinomycetota bacterium]
MAQRVVMSWSGGKDSALALHHLLGDPDVEVIGLLTTVTEEYERISMHGVRVELLRAQAAAIGLPVIEVWIPPGCTNEFYEGRMTGAYRHPLMLAAEAIASGDIWLQNVRAYREQRIRGAGKEPLFPIWGRASSELAEEFIAFGFRAVITCVDPEQADPGICGNEFDRELLASLPPEVDPCGENGEFHSFVYAGPYFTTAVPVARGELVERGGFFFRDLMISEPTSMTSVGD